MSPNAKRIRHYWCDVLGQLALNPLLVGRSSMTRRFLLLLGVLPLAIAAAPAFAPDESVYVKNLKAGERESILYVWTRDGDGKESDYLSVVDVDPKSASYGKIIATTPTNSPGNEAHHFGYTATPTASSARDVTTSCSSTTSSARRGKPVLLRTVDLDATGYTGRTPLYAVPGGVMIAMLAPLVAAVWCVSNGRRRRQLQAGMAGRSTGRSAGFMYDVGVKPEMNSMTPRAGAPRTHQGRRSSPASPPPPPPHLGRMSWVGLEEKKVLQVQELDLPARGEVDERTQCEGWIRTPRSGTRIWYWDDTNRDGQLEFHRVISCPTKLDTGRYAHQL